MKRLHHQKFFLKRLVIILSLTFIINSCIVEPDNEYHGDNSYTATQDFFYRIGTENRFAFDLYNINGSVEITGVSDLSLVEIWGEKKVESDSRSDAESHLALLNIMIDSSRTGIAVRTTQPSQSDGRNYTVHYHIRIPQDWMIRIDQINGKVNVYSLSSAVGSVFNSEKGTFDSLKSKLQVSIVNGSLLLNNVYRSINGQIVNGDITGNAALPPDGECILAVTNGVINISFPGTTSAQFSAVTVNGAVVVSGLNLHDAQIGQKAVTGRLGDGRGRIDLNGVNTSILVSGSD
ncbi:MAG: hypothetical protein JXL67_13870 [Calditrichaeota bacterium]|nr:hypothetical protein [Calditrichota bacterium]